ncbi:5602_t:CDS:2, partial [Dentiscutata heterogama]
DYVLTSEDLSSSSPLLIYTATMVPNSYIPDNQGGQESFVMARRLYNGVTNNKNIKSKPSSTTSNTRVTSEVELDIHLDSIEEKINPRNLLDNKHSNDKTTSFNFADLILQIQKRTPSARTTYVEPSSSTANCESSSQNTNQSIPSRVTHVEDEDDTFISDNDSIKPSHVQ